MTTRVISSTTLSQSEADRDDHRSTGSIRSLGKGDLGGRGEERRAEAEERPGGRTPGPIEIARQVKHRASQRPPPDPPRTQQTASTPLAQTGERSPTLEGTASVHSARTRRRAHEALTAPCPNARPGTASRTADGWDPGPSPRRQHQLQVARWGQSGALSNLLTVCCTHHQLVHDGSLGIERDTEGLVFRFGDGRVVRTTHVGSRGRGRARARARAATAVAGPRGGRGQGRHKSRSTFCIEAGSKLLCSRQARPPSPVTETGGGGTRAAGTGAHEQVRGAT